MKSFFVQKGISIETQLIGYISLVVFSALTQYFVPTKLSIVEKELTFGIGFHPIKESFDITSGIFNRFSQRIYVNIYFSGKKENIEDYEEIYGNSLVIASIKEDYEYLNGKVETFSKEIENISLQIDSITLRSEKIHLSSHYGSDFVRVKYHFYFKGCLSQFSELNFQQVSINERYTIIEVWYHCLFMIFGVILSIYKLFKASALPRPEIVHPNTFSLLIFFSPLLVSMFYQEKYIVYFLYTLFRALFSIYVFLLWLYIIVSSIPMDKSLMCAVKFSITCFCLLLFGISFIDSFTRSKIEYNNVIDWISMNVGIIDFFIVLSVIFSIFISYMIILGKRHAFSKSNEKSNISTWVDVPTASFFFALFARLADEILYRLRMPQYMYLAHFIRIFSEVSCVFLLVFNQKDVKVSDNKELLSDIHYSDKDETGWSIAF